MSALDRYSVPDAYTLLELQRRYETADTNGKIAFLEELKLRGPLPFEIELLAVEDPNVKVRQWIARHGNNLKYTSHFRRTDTGWIHENIEPTFYARLDADPDPLVRASLRENPHTVSILLWKEFQSCDHLSRLALMRNSELRYSRDFLKTLLDPDDNELHIDKREREDLILASLTNADVIKMIEEKADLSDNPTGEKPYRSDIDSANSLLNNLWTSAAKWPTEKLPAPVPALVYRHLPANDTTRARIYGSCLQPILRKVILESCSKRDIETLKLGVRDEDDNCRSTARWKIDELNLDSQIDAYPEEPPSSQKSLFNKFKEWAREGEDVVFMIAFLAFVLFSLYQIVFTEQGNRLFARIYGDPVGMFLTWVIGGIAALLTLVFIQALIGQYRWFHHCFWLGLIAWSEFVSKDRWMTWTFMACYLGPMLLPKIWEELSNELANKIATRLNGTKTGGS